MVDLEFCSSSGQLSLIDSFASSLYSILMIIYVVVWRSFNSYMAIGLTSLKL